MITITGIPFYDGIIEGALFIPKIMAELISPNLYVVGFWIGVCFFVVIALRLVFGWDARRVIRDEN